MQAVFTFMRTCDASSIMQTGSRFTSHAQALTYGSMLDSVASAPSVAHQFVIQLQKLKYVIERPHQYVN